MNVSRLIWHLPRVLGFVVASLCANGMEFDGNYADDYDNEISQDQQEDASPTSFHAADFSRWDRLFIALEDSHMQQNLLLESVEQCRGGMSHLRTQVDKLVKGDLLQRAPSIEAAVERVGVRLQREVDELRAEEAEREARLNAAMQTLLSSGRVGNVWLKHLEEDGRRTASPASRTEPDVTTPLGATAKERALVVVTTELEKVHLLLTRVITQVEALRRDRGDV